MSEIKTVCVYCSSSNSVPKPFFDAAEELGGLLAKRQLTLVYGGANVGLMGVLAKSVHLHGGRVVGVIPTFMRECGIVYEAADERIVTETMRERKDVMERRADAFVALPGGFGTLEEILEVLTLRQLGRHHKPIVFLDTAGFFQPLLKLFEQIYADKFAKPEYRQFYNVAETPADALNYLAAFTPPPTVSKWL